MDTSALLRALPKTDDVLESPEVAGLVGAVPRPLVVDAVREAVDAVRERILAGDATVPDASAIARDAVVRALGFARPSLRRVINATGIIVHTNLGRSVLSEAAVRAVNEVARNYSTLEYDVDSGERGSRHVHVESLLCRLTGAEAALAVNNNAAAVMLGLAALARGKEAIVSRGQLVEIGGSFRIPDIMRESGAQMVEVGTTNKTHLKDYEQAVTPQTGLLLKVHSSNFRVVGFTAEVGVRELVDLGSRHGIPVFEDQGSGVLIDLQKYGLPAEPTVGESIRDGADLVSCSGDKLLGGPQAGILVGRWEIIQQLKKHPMARALRLDKLTLAALEATLRAYIEEPHAVMDVPTLRMLTMPLEQCREAAHALAHLIREAADSEAVVGVMDEVARAGGGSLPLAEIPTSVVTVAPRTMSVGDLERRLRTVGEPSVVARVKEGRILLDPRTLVGPEQPGIVARRIGEALRP